MKQLRRLLTSYFDANNNNYTLSGIKQSADSKITPDGV